MPLDQYNLIIDEADSLPASRTGNQSHEEYKVAVNTLIQKVDDSRRLNGRLLVILCTNRYQDIDSAIMRRAAYIEAFLRARQDRTPRDPRTRLQRSWNLGHHP